MTGRNNLPNLVIAGVTKAGTTSLFTYLKLHRDICVSRVKETCYFLPVRYNTQQEPLEIYKSFFNHCGKTSYIMEATPGYYYGGKRVAQAIHDAVGDAYIIVVLREPISRMFSFYKYLKSRLLLPKGENFSHYVKQCRDDSSPRFDSGNFDLFWGIDGGFYDEYLPDWFSVFSNHLKIVFFDDITRHPRKCLKEICTWLELDGSIYETGDLDIENRSVGYRSGKIHKLVVTINDWAEQLWRRFPNLKQTLRAWYYRINGEEFEESIAPETRAQLESIFHPHNRKLATQLTCLGYDNLPNWLKVDNG